MSDLRRVLFVEDQPAIFDILELALQKIVGSKPTALSLAEKPCTGRPDTTSAVLAGRDDACLGRACDACPASPGGGACGRSAVFLTAKVEQSQVDRLLALARQQFSASRSIR